MDGIQRGENRIMNLETYRITCLSEAITPISHMMGVSGNEALINREPVLHKGNTVYLPTISGNALRHKMIREYGMNYLISVLGLAGKLNLSQLNFMFTGGSLEESSVTDNLKRIADMQYLFPLFRVLGGSLKNQILTGSLMVDKALLICEEHREIIEKMKPDNLELPTDRLLGAESFIGQYQYTRGEASKKKNIDLFLAMEELNKDREGDKSNLMIYNGQTIIKGSLFFHEIILPNVSYNELGAVLFSMSNWQEHGGIIGGKSSIGHGKLKTSIILNMDIDINDCIENYKAHVDKTKLAACDWLNDAFADKPKKEKVKK